MNGHKAVVKLLLTPGAAVISKNDIGQTLLPFYGAIKNTKTMVK